MGVDQTLLDVQQQPTVVTIERGRVQQFAKAIGDHDPTHVDYASARAAGHPDLPAPPTMLFGLELETSDIFEILSSYGVDLGQVLHGEQTFRYFAPLYAGDEVTMKPSFVDVYSKAGGALDFVVRRVEVWRGETKTIELRSTTVIRNQPNAQQRTRKERGHD